MMDPLHITRVMQQHRIPAISKEKSPHAYLRAKFDSRIPLTLVLNKLKVGIAGLC
jgi:hypothetical protein